MQKLMRHLHTYGKKQNKKQLMKKKCIRITPYHSIMLHVCLNIRVDSVFLFSKIAFQYSSEHDCSVNLALFENATHIHRRMCM